MNRPFDDGESQKGVLYMLVSKIRLMNKPEIISLLYVFIVFLKAFLQ